MRCEARICSVLFLSVGVLSPRPAGAQDVPPPNDACARAIEIAPGDYEGSLAGATSDGSATVGPPGQPDVWYRYTAPGAGTLTVTTCGTSDFPRPDLGIDTVLSVHSDCPGNARNELDGSDDWNGDFGCAGLDTENTVDSALRLELDAGQRVYIRVTNYGEPGGGDFFLHLRFAPVGGPTDLVLQHLSVDPEYAGVSQEVTMTAFVHNTGPEPLEDVRVRFLVGDEPLETLTIPVIDNGATEAVVTRHTFQEPAQYLISAIADPEGTQPDSDRGNNRAEAPLEVVWEIVSHPARPDVTISELDLAPSRPFAGDTVQCSVALANTRPFDVDSGIRVELLIDGERVDKAEVEGLGPESVVVELFWDEAEPGRHLLTAVVSTDDSAADRDLSNNRVDSWLRVGGEAEPLPDLEVSEIQIEAVEPDRGEPARIRVELRNEGYAPVSDLPVRVLVDTRAIAELVVPGLEPLETTQLTFDWEEIGQGTHRIVVLVDPEDTVRDDSVRSAWVREVIVPGVQYHSLARAMPRWESIGPRPIRTGSAIYAGRVHSIAISSDHPRVIFAGTPTGGVWRTFDSGQSWWPQGDHLPSSDQTPAVLDPRDDHTLYVGSAAGILRSQDQGDRWQTFTPGNRFGGDHRLVLDMFLRYDDPGDPDELTIYAITYASSNNSVRVWQGPRTAANDADGTWTLVFSRPHNSGLGDVLVTAEASPWVYVNFRQDIFRMTLSTLRANLGNDAFLQGAWTAVSTGLPSDARYMQLDSSAAQPGLVYAAVARSQECSQDQGGTFEIRRLEQGTWQLWTTATAHTGVCGLKYIGGFRVHPDDPTTVFLCGVKGWRFSEDALGNKLTFPLSGPHDDYHAIAFDPDDHTTIYFGTDGGVFRCTGNGQSCVSLNHHLENAQLFDIAISRTDPVRIMAGTMDNGNIRVEAPSLEWEHETGGDGLYCAVDPLNSDILYAEDPANGATLSRSLDGGGSWTAIRTGPYWIHWHLVVHPGDPQQLLLAENTVLRSPNRGDTWLDLGPTVDATTGNVVRLAIDSVGGRYYAGTDRGRIYTARESVPTDWAHIHTQLYGAHTVGLLVDPDDSDQLYATFSGTGAWRVVLLRHAGGWPGTWSGEDITGTGAGSLPTDRILKKSLAIGGLVKDALTDRLYVGTDRGVYRGAQAQGGNWVWVPYNCGMPLTYVSDLEYDPLRRLLYASTFGRGAYRRSLMERLPGPDRYETPNRNDSLAHAAHVGTVQEGIMRPGLVVDDLTLDRAIDVDYFTIDLAAGVDECLPDSDLSLSDPRTQQGQLTIMVHAPDSPDPFEIRLYNGTSLFREFHGRSSLTYHVECPRRYFAGEITLSVRSPTGCLSEYDLHFYYHGWYDRRDAPDLLYDPPLVRVIPRLENIRFLFPPVPEFIQMGFVGRTLELPEQRIVFEWEAAGDFNAQLSIEGGANLDATLYDAAGAPLMSALPRAGLQGNGGGGESAVKQLAVPELPSGWYQLGLSNGELPTYYSVTFGAGDGERFRRGDCNDDGAVDVSDAVFTLGWLFVGDGDPGCDDACDSNDDGAVDISDAVVTLGVLFLGRGAIPLPGVHECGVDPTSDEMGCETPPVSCR